MFPTTTETAIWEHYRDDAMQILVVDDDAAAAEMTCTLFAERLPHVIEMAQRASSIRERLGGRDLRDFSA